MGKKMCRIKFWFVKVSMNKTNIKKPHVMNISCIFPIFPHVLSSSLLVFFQAALSKPADRDFWTQWGAVPTPKFSTAAMDPPEFQLPKVSRSIWKFYVVEVFVEIWAVDSRVSCEKVSLTNFQRLSGRELWVGGNSCAMWSMYFAVFCWSCCLAPFGRVAIDFTCDVQQQEMLQGYLHLNIGDDSMENLIAQFPFHDCLAIVVIWNPFPSNRQDWYIHLQLP